MWVSGRVRKEELASLLGTTALPIVMANDPLARSILHKAHREDHRRGPRDAAARSLKSSLDSRRNFAVPKTVIAACFPVSLPG